MSLLLLQVMRRYSFKTKIIKRFRLHFAKLEIFVCAAHMFCGVEVLGRYMNHKTRQNEQSRNNNSLRKYRYLISHLIAKFTTTFTYLLNFWVIYLFIVIVHYLTISLSFRLTSLVACLIIDAVVDSTSYCFLFHIFL